MKHLKPFIVLFFVILWGGAAFSLFTGRAILEEPAAMIVLAICLIIFGTSVIRHRKVLAEERAKSMHATMSRLPRLVASFFKSQDSVGTQQKVMYMAGGGCIFFGVVLAIAGIARAI